MKQSFGCILMVLACLLPACRERALVGIDNPTDERIRIQLDGESTEILPQQLIWSELTLGEHTLVVQDSNRNERLNKKFILTGPGLVRTSPAGYVLCRKVYAGDNLAKEKIGAQLPDNEVVIHGQRFEGPYDLVKDDNIFLEKSWDYYPTENFPARLAAPHTDTFMIRTKLFREDDFLGEYDRSLANLLGEMAEISDSMAAVLDSMGIDAEVGDVIRYLKLEAAKNK